jgi:nucleoid DNA-binding protein
MGRGGQDARLGESRHEGTGWQVSRDPDARVASILSFTLAHCQEKPRAGGRNGLASCGKSTLITVCPVEDSQVFASVPIKWKEKRVATKTTGAPKPPSKTEVLASVAERTGLSKKQVGDVLQAYTEEVTKSLGKKGPGVFAALGLVKIEKKLVPAQKAQKGVPNPFKPGELMDRPAKPAYQKVKVRALKLLKDAVK